MHTRKTNGDGRLRQEMQSDMNKTRCLYPRLKQYRAAWYQGKNHKTTGFAVRFKFGPHKMCNSVTRHTSSSIILLVFCSGEHDTRNDRSVRRIQKTNTGGITPTKVDFGHTRIRTIWGSTVVNIQYE